jgi:ketosteroid isomerase-like protein
MWRESPIFGLVEPKITVSKTVSGEFPPTRVALGRIEGRGSKGGVPVDAPMGIVIDFRGSEISRARSFLDHGEARKAVGLED